FCQSFHPVSASKEREHHGGEPGGGPVPSFEAGGVSWEHVMTIELTTSLTLFEQLKERIELRTARVAVVGLGYVGLPLAGTFAAAGYPVVGFGTDPHKGRNLT